MTATSNLQKTHQINISKKTQVSLLWKKNEKMLEQKCKSYEKNTKSYLAANNEHLSQRINELTGKLNDLQASI